MNANGLVAAVGNALRSPSISTIAPNKEIYDLPKIAFGSMHNLERTGKQKEESECSSGGRIESPAGIPNCGSRAGFALQSGQITQNQHRPGPSAQVTVTFTF